MKTRLVRIVTLVIVLGLFLTACAPAVAPEPTQGTEPTQGPEPTQVAAQPTAAVDRMSGTI